MHVHRNLQPTDEDLDAIHALLARSMAADGHHPLSDHAWLDLVDGGRPGFAALTAWEQDHDHPVGYAQISRTGGNWSLDLVIDPHHRFEGIEISELLLREALQTIAEQGGGHLHLWVSHPSKLHDQLAERSGLKRGRDLLQLRVALPLPQEFGEGPETRAFRVGSDESAWVEVNNRAFAWHPEQGGWTVDTVRRREKEAWFDADGFRLHEVDGKLAAFCWTKAHADHEPPLGEIYVIAADPAFHGRGLGRGLTIAGLRWLERAGFRTGMLYVDADNAAAVTLYKSLGFTLDHVNRAYVVDVQATPK